MNKALKLHFLRHTRSEIRELVKSKLARRNNSFRAEIKEHTRTLCVCDSGLRRDVYRNIGRIFFRVREYSEVGYYERIDPRGAGAFKKRRELLQLGGIRDNIAGKVDLDAVFMGECHGF